MQLVLKAGGQRVTLDMEQSDQVLVVGAYRYHPAQMARKVRRLATQMWGSELSPHILSERLTFEAPDGNAATNSWTDSGSFSPASGSLVTLGRWDENGSVGIALHELAHEMHMRNGGYDHSDGVLREGLSLLAERESGLLRTFEREPYYTASNLIGQLSEMSNFARQPFIKRWSEVISLSNDVGLADLINFYLDRNERLGLARWLNRFSPNVEARDLLLSRLATTSLRYSLNLRRQLIEQLVRCPTNIGLEQVVALLEAIIALDRRHPRDDLGQIIDFCFAPHIRRRRLFAFS